MKSYSPVHVFALEPGATTPTWLLDLEGFITFDDNGVECTLYTVKGWDIARYGDVITASWRHTEYEIQLHKNVFRPKLSLRERFKRGPRGVERKFSN